MSTQPGEYDTQDTKIIVDDDYDVYVWSLVLGVSPQLVREVASAVGPDARDVMAELGRRGADTALGGE